MKRMTRGFALLLALMLAALPATSEAPAEDTPGVVMAAAVDPEVAEVELELGGEGEYAEEDYSAEEYESDESVEESPSEE